MSKDRRTPHGPNAEGADADGPEAGSEQPVVSAAVPSPPAINGDLTPDDDDLPAVEDPALLGAALRQELAGDGGLFARRVVIGIGVVIFAALLAMVVYALRTRPAEDEPPRGARSAQRRETSSRKPVRTPTHRSQPRPRPSSTTPASSSAAPLIDSGLGGS